MKSKEHCAHFGGLFSFDRIKVAKGEEDNAKPVLSTKHQIRQFYIPENGENVLSH